MLREAGRYLVPGPVFLLGMSPGATVETIRAAHRKACEDGGGCILGQHGGNSVKGRTPEQHAKAVGGRASLHEDAINILFANWNALPLTWRPPTFFKAVIRPQSYTASKVFEQRMIHHVLSFHYNEKVGELQTQSKVHVADRYNEHFKYEAGDPGFVVCTSDGRGKRAT